MKLGIIGGSGIYDMEALQAVHTETITTPFGAPSDPYVCGKIGGVDVAFLPRHGRGHRLLPAEINHRANIYGMKQLGMDAVISISAVGSLREELRPRDIVLPDQYFDRTKRSLEHTFFGQGVVAHISFAEPTCPVLRAVIADAAREAVEKEKLDDIEIHTEGTYVNMEGPAFSTKAESHAYRQMGFDVIGMTSLGEAKLCREAEMCYQSMAMVTDYDCWHESEEAVTVEAIIGHLHANTALAKKIVATLPGQIPAKRECGCTTALAGAIMTAKDVVPAETRSRLALIAGKYL